MNRIAGLSVQARPHHALVVLRREDGVWCVESAKTSTADPVLAFEAPGCPVVLDATSFWQDAGHAGTSDAEQLRAAGWDVRAPIAGPMARNPTRSAMQAHLDEMMESGRLKPSPMLGEGVVEALHLAAWGATQQDTARKALAGASSAP